MKYLSLLFGISVLLFQGIELSIAQTCSSYVDSNVKPTNYDAVERLLSEVPSEKGEFETTVDFESRVATIISTWPENFLIGYDGHVEYLKYDADNRQMMVDVAIFFGGYSFFSSYDDVFGWGDNDVDFGVVDNLDIIVSMLQEIRGSYEASNSFGATVTVTEYNWVYKIIFDRNLDSEFDGDILDKEIFVNQHNGVLGNIPMSVSDAKLLKKSAKVAVLISPRKPYFASGTGRSFPTIRSPADIYRDTSVIIADIQCAFLLDGNSKVLGAYTVR